MLPGPKICKKLPKTTSRYNALQCYPEQQFVISQHSCQKQILQNLQKKRCSGPLFAKSTTIHYNNFPRELIKKIHDDFALSTLNSLFRQSPSCEPLSVSRPVLISKSSQGRRQTCVLAASDQADLHPRPHPLSPLSHSG